MVRPPDGDSAMGRSQVVRHRILIPAFPGSNPGAPANPDWSVPDTLNNSTEHFKSLERKMACVARRARATGHRVTTGRKATAIGRKATTGQKATATGQRANSGSHHAHSLPMRPNPKTAAPAAAPPGAGCESRSQAALQSRRLLRAKRGHFECQRGGPWHPDGYTRPASRLLSARGESAARSPPPPAGASPRTTAGRAAFWVSDRSRPLA